MCSFYHLHHTIYRVGLDLHWSCSLLPPSILQGPVAFNVPPAFRSTLPQRVVDGHPTIVSCQTPIQGVVPKFQHLHDLGNGR